MADDCNDCSGTTPIHTHATITATTLPIILAQPPPPQPTQPPPPPPPSHAYLHLIDDLAYDLDSLRADIVQNDCQSRAYALSDSFESTLKELEQHNDRLQQALEEAKAKDQLCAELQQKNNDLGGKIARLEKQLFEKQTELDKSEKLIRKLSTKKCKCLSSSQSPGASNAINEDMNCQISRFESELANANKIIEDLRIELAKRNDMLAETSYKDTELEAYEVECNRLHKINQALTHEICRSSACRSALDRAKDCMYAMHAEMSRLHQHETQNIESLKKDCEIEVKHYRDRYNEVSQELNSEREHKSQLMGVVRQLNKEQAEAKHKNADLVAEIQKLRSLFDVQRKTYDNLVEKHNTLSSNFELQSGSLHSCHKQIAQLQDRFFELEKINKADEVETRLLRDEVIYFKREISSLQTKLMGGEEREHKFINKIEKLHKIINEQDKKLQIAEASHKQIVDDLQRAKTDVSSRFDILSQQYQSLDQSYSKQTNYIQEMAKIMESYRLWKAAQLKADEEHAKKYKLYEEHIHLLLLDRQRFVVQLRDLHRDFEILQNELKRLQCDQRTVSESGGATDQVLQQRMHLLHQTLWRIAECESTPRTANNKLFANITQSTTADSSGTTNADNNATLQTTDSRGENNNYTSSSGSSNTMQNS